jgi:hypothetical protein
MMSFIRANHQKYTYDSIIFVDLLNRFIRQITKQFFVFRGLIVK